MNIQNYSSDQSKNIDLSEFDSLSKSDSSSHSLTSDPSYNDWKENRRKLLEERRQIEERTLQNSKVSLNMVCETEKIGLNTAQELVRQREQLNIVEDKLDSMNSIMKVSQKHLTSMKSFFGGLKSRFSRNTDNTSETNSCGIDLEERRHKCDDSLTSAIEEMNRSSSIDDYRNNTTLSHKGINTIQSDDHKQTNTDQQNQVFNYWLKSVQINEEVNRNLDEIDSGVGRLKQLSLGLGNEIDSQNSLLDRINKQTDKNELTLKDQNKQMRQILRK